jgi:hypothetical protein
MSVNDNLSRGEIVHMAVPIAANGGVGPNSGDVLIFGSASSPAHNLAGVVQASYTPPGSRTATGLVPVKFVGAFNLTVAAKSTINPGTGQTIVPGDPIFADGGTYDATTGCTYGCTLNCNATRGYLVGNALTGLASGTTGTVIVRLATGGR